MDALFYLKCENVIAVLNPKNIKNNKYEISFSFYDILYCSYMKNHEKSSRYSYSTNITKFKI